MSEVDYGKVYENVMEERWSVDRGYGADQGHAIAAVVRAFVTSDEFATLLSAAYAKVLADEVMPALALLAKLERAETPNADGEELQKLADDLVNSISTNAIRGCSDNAMVAGTLAKLRPLFAYLRQRAETAERALDDKRKLCDKHKKVFRDEMDERAGVDSDLDYDYGHATVAVTRAFDVSDEFSKVLAAAQCNRWKQRAETAEPKLSDENARDGMTLNSLQLDVPNEKSWSQQARETHERDCAKVKQLESDLAASRADAERLREAVNWLSHWPNSDLVPLKASLRFACSYPADVPPRNRTCHWGDTAADALLAAHAAATGGKTDG